MAGSFGDYLEDKVLSEVFGATAYTAETTLYFALYTTAGSITDASDGSAANEVSGGSYARKAVTNNTTNFPASSGGAGSNGTAITFATATASWGTINQVAVFNGNAGTSADKLVIWADLTAAKTVGSGDTASFAVGDFDYTLT